MQIGMMGLGRMGANMAARLMEGGHQVVAYDISPDAVAALVQEGATGASDTADLITKLSSPRAIWLMLPAAITGKIVRELAEQLEPGDILIDGGNSFYQHDMELAAELKNKQIHFVDVGTSGGVWGRERGYCLMIGGETETVQHLDPIFATLAPGGEKSSAANLGTASLGYLHCGPSGAGHFVKMVHNGIEYGLMAAYAEGFNILAGANAGSETRAKDAETAPLADPHFYQFDMNIPAIAEVWRHGSVIGSWLLDLTAVELKDDPKLDRFDGHVSDSGEGRWTLNAAIDTGVPAPVLSAALFNRFASRGNDDYANKMLSAMRYAFGGHHEKSEAERD